MMLAQKPFYTTESVPSPREWIPAPDQVEGRLCAGMTNKASGAPW